MTGYAETYCRSLERPEEFWAEAAEAIDWERRWDRVLDDSRPPFYRWFAGGRLNTCWNAVDRQPRRAWRQMKSVFTTVVVTLAKAGVQSLLLD
jgi:propionyl-CoA synthetase